MGAISPMSKTRFYGVLFNGYVLLDILYANAGRKSIFSTYRNDVDKAHCFTSRKSDVFHRSDTFRWRNSVTRKFKIGKI